MPRTLGKDPGRSGTSWGFANIPISYAKKTEHCSVGDSLPNSWDMAALIKTKLGAKQNPPVYLIAQEVCESKKFLWFHCPSWKSFSILVSANSAR